MGPDHGEVEHDCAYRVQTPAPVELDVTPSPHDEEIVDYAGFIAGEPLVIERQPDGSWLARTTHRSARWVAELFGHGETPDNALVDLAKAVASTARPSPSP